MQPTDSVDLEYAECFSVDHYDGGYSLITVKDDARYLVVPENASVPDGLDADIVVLQQPLDSIYLVSSSVMDQFVALDALDSIALSGTKQDGWYIDEAKQAMADGKITYAGKYSAPDYETIYSADCNLAIENTMIYHTPEVKDAARKAGYSGVCRAFQLRAARTRPHGVDQGVRYAARLRGQGGKAICG